MWSWVKIRVAVLETAQLISYFCLGSFIPIILNHRRLYKTRARTLDLFFFSQFLTEKKLLINCIGRCFFPKIFPNSVFEPYFLDQGPFLNSELVGDFQTFDWISQWLELLKRKDEDGIRDFWPFLGHKFCFWTCDFSWTKR